MYSLITSLANARANTSPARPGRAQGDFLRLNANIYAICNCKCAASVLVRPGAYFTSQIADPPTIDATEIAPLNKTCIGKSSSRAGQETIEVNTLPPVENATLPDDEIGVTKPSHVSRPAVEASDPAVVVCDPAVAIRKLIAITAPPPSASHPAALHIAFAI